MARYGEGFGSDYRTDDNRDRWRDERERSSWHSGGQGSSERDDERGFFQRAGDEIRSWFNEDDDRSGRDYGRDYERGSFGGRSSWDRDNYSRSGSTGPGSSWEREQSSGSGRDRERSYGRIGSGGSSHLNEDRSELARRSHGQFGRPTGSWDRDRERGLGSSSGTQRFGSSSSGFGGFRDEVDFRGRRHRGHPQSWGEANRGENESLGFGKFQGTLGGFGNQTFGSSEHDHYRSWRDREMAKLDRDYDDYCREREHQFNQDFDSWRRNRPNPTASSSTLELGSSSNAGVGTTTASMTGSAGAGSAPGSATTHAGTIQSDTSSTETSGSSRSGSRSRS